MVLSDYPYNLQPDLQLLTIPVNCTRLQILLVISNVTTALQTNISDLFPIPLTWNYRELKQLFLLKCYKLTNNLT